MLEDLYCLLRSGHVQAQGVVDTMTQPIVVLNQNLYVITANNAFIKTFKVERDDILDKSFFSLGDGQWDVPELRTLIAAVIPRAAAVIGFEVKHDFPSIGPRTFLVDVRRFIQSDDNGSNILVLFDDVMERQHQTAEVEFIISETRHRMKNLLSVVRAIAMQTEVKDVTAAKFRQALLGRLETTCRAQEIAATNETADFVLLVKQSVSGPGLNRIRCAGPAVEIAASKVLPVSTIFQELTTKAVKYGALSVSGGEFDISWRVELGPKDRKCVVCHWREENGPTVQEPVRTGYGMNLIKATAAQAGGTAELNYEKSGLIATIRIAV